MGSNKVKWLQASARELDWAQASSSESRWAKNMGMWW